MSRCRSRHIRATRPSGLIRFAISPARAILAVCALCTLFARASSAQPPRTAVMDLRAGERARGIFEHGREFDLAMADEGIVHCRRPPRGDRE